MAPYVYQPDLKHKLVLPTEQTELIDILTAEMDVLQDDVIAGKSGARKITEFDVSDMPCQIANFVPRGDGSNGTFNPDQWMEPKEQRKVDDFIIYAMAAADQALADSGYKAVTPEQQERTGVMMGAGIGGGFEDGRNFVIGQSWQHRAYHHAGWYAGPGQRFQCAQPHFGA